MLLMLLILLWYQHY